MPARRCSTCSLNYPNLSKHEKCLRCGQDTWFGANVEPMSQGDLKEIEAEVQSVQEASAGLNEQWLVTYYDRKGQNPNGDYRTEIFYTTAYTVSDAREAVRECMRRHGDDCQARAIVATGRPPKDSGPVAVTV